MPVIRDNPQWGILDFLYGFGSHEFDPCALDLCAKNHIISSKEDPKTSHFNQAYNKLLANNDKKIMAETLASRRKMKHVNGGVVDHYQLVHRSINIIKKTSR